MAKFAPFLRAKDIPVDFGSGLFRGHFNGRVRLKFRRGLSPRGRLFLFDRHLCMSMETQDVRKTLSEIKTRIDRELGLYLDRAIKETGKHDAFMMEALRYVRTLALSGGKRLRAAFMCSGYLAGGGTDRERMLKTAISIELVHLFLLIHDDIIDRDEKRHGIVTAHEHFRALGDRFGFRRDTAHFGNSVAIIVGDMVGALGNQVIFESGFPAERVLRALSKLQEIVSFTVVGEAEDIMIEYRGTATEQEILSMYEHKTARYTVDGPIQLGLLLAGESTALSEPLGKFSIPVGIAFQIQDDILGVFGAEEKLGKPVGSDIEEGKVTILVSRALELASKSEREELLAILRRGAALSVSEIERFRDIVRMSGALSSARELAARYINEGRNAILDVDMPDEPKRFLLGIADYMANREC